MLTNDIQGLQVAPAELEAHLLTHPFVADVAVIPVPDDKAGEVPKAYIVKSASVPLEENDQYAAFLFPLPLPTFYRVPSDPVITAIVARPPANKAPSIVARDIQKFVEQHKSRHKWLAGGVEFIDVIPKSPSGKILRRFLRDKEKEERRKKGARI